MLDCVLHEGGVCVFSVSVLYLCCFYCLKNNLKKVDYKNKTREKASDQDSFKILGFI